MRRFAGFALLAVAVVGPSACSSSDVSFIVRDGLCYRKLVHKTAGCTNQTSVVKAFQADCGLPPRPEETQG